MSKEIKDSYWESAKKTYDWYYNFQVAKFNALSVLQIDEFKENCYLQGLSGFENAEREIYPYGSSLEHHKVEIVPLNDDLAKQVIVRDTLDYLIAIQEEPTTIMQEAYREGKRKELRKNIPLELLAKLTRAESEMFSFMMEGLSQTEIAKKKGISLSATSQTFKHMVQKLSGESNEI